VKTLQFYVAVDYEKGLDMAGPFDTREQAQAWVDNGGARWFGPFAEFHIGIPMAPAHTDSSRVPLGVGECPTCGGTGQCQHCDGSGMRDGGES
jgi:hypothetical protein